MDIINLLLLASAVFLTFYFWIRRHDPKLPPCPAAALPIFGHVFYLGSNPRTVFKKWRKKCGDIYSLYFGQSLVVVLNGYDLHKEVLVKNADKFTDRPYVLYDAIVSGASGNGITFSSGELWKENRTATVTILRALGMGKVSMAEKITEIATINNELIASLKGVPTDIFDLISASVANIICYIIMGHHFKHDDENYIKAIRYVRQNIEDADARNVVNYLPFLLKLPGDLFKTQEARNRSRFIRNTLFEPFIKDRISKPLDELEMNDFISLYLFQRNKKLKAGESTYMDDANLRKVVYDLFVAAMDTTASTILWGILYFLHYPEVQDKVYNEIEKEIGTEKPPTMSDSNKLPYMNAFIRELLRVASIVPWSVVHICTEATTVRGYTIPKGTQVIPNLDSILHEKTLWGEDVYALRPDRFLDDNGKLKNPEEFVPFSLGRRLCPGEALSKMELFLFLSWMIQRFKFLPEDPKALPSLNIRFGITTCPYPFKVRAVDRKHI